jgi:hypothetical protein
MATPVGTSPLEKENLEVHVDMCAMRYAHLETRLEKVENKLDEVVDILQKSQQSTAKIVFSSTATVVAAAISVIVAILLKGGL